ncbi:hypothetical protein ACLQ90_02205 [Avibacterium paragallinarum]|uniref:Uncharacterized protein n=1 Tax=Avibacterium paragallinarum TaxID=728 RepID=A0AAE5WHJ1_AVIPA|nr:hypothetical protein [Avibacterium paragallinarum]MEE3607713.1 hypothetical protein [Avibacterium paragallinarum]MEE3620401.1 hypothetical protein [Avibacterium paragallinarum]MEE3668422.1 hypothetical protein [Avibacterium paragallinarum]MEE3680778.1 hypothetical protein [Avibacterium paragallinarum]MEE4385525.1 hypothetical protein [Avibacterium paragallinarum]
MCENSYIQNQFISIEELIEWALPFNENDREKALRDLIRTLHTDCYLYEKISGIKPRIIKSTEPALLKALDIRLKDYLESIDDIPF